MLIVQTSNVKTQSSKFKEENRLPCLEDKSSLLGKYFRIWKILKRIFIKGVKHC